MAKQNETPAGQTQTPATAGQNDALTAVLAANAALTEARANLARAEKDRAFFDRKCAKLAEAVKLAEAGQNDAVAKLSAPTAS